MPRLSVPSAATLIPAVVISGALALEARGPQHVSDRPELSGAWTLNAALSEEVPLLPGEAASAARAAGVLPVASARRKTNTGLDLHEVVRVRTVVRQMLAAAERLSVAHEEGRVVLTDASGHSMALLPGGEPVRAERAGVTVELRARWQPPALVLERRFPDRTVVTEHYTTFSDPRQLVVTSTFANPRIDEPEGTLMRVYDLDR